MPGSARTQSFLLSDATVMIGPLSDLHLLNPEQHSIGLVKNFALVANPEFIELKHGLPEQVYMSVRKTEGLKCTMNVYEHTARNLAYAAGIDATGSNYNPVMQIFHTTIGAIPGSTGVIVEGDATSLQSEWMYLQQTGSDVVHQAQVIDADFDGTDTTLDFTGSPTPPSVTFPAGSKVGQLERIDVGANLLAMDYVSAKVVGLLPQDKRPFIMMFPKVRITRGLAINFDLTDFSSLPFEFTPYVQLATDPFWDLYGKAAAILFPSGTPDAITDDGNGGGGGIGDWTAFLNGLAEALAARDAAIAARDAAEQWSIAASNWNNEAQLAAVLAVAAAPLYVDTTAGLAATVDGDYFCVIGDNANTFARLYRRVAGVAVDQLKAIDTSAVTQAFSLIISQISVSGNENALTLKQLVFEDATDDWAAGHLLPIRDSAGRLLFSILTTGETQIGNTKHWSFDEGQYETGGILPAIAGSSILSDYDRLTGRFRALIHPTFLTRSEQEADLSPQTIIDLGGRGTIYKVRKALTGKFYKYISDGLPMITRSNIANRAHFLDTTSTIAIFAYYGQSWMTNTFGPISELIRDYDTEQETALTIHYSTNGVDPSGPVPVTIGISYKAAGGGTGATFTDDLVGFPDTFPVSIQIASMIALARFRRRRKVYGKPYVGFTFAYPSSGWNFGGDDDVGLKTTGTTWARGLRALADSQAQITSFGKTSVQAGMSWIQGGDPTETYSQNYDDLTALVAGLTAAGYTNLYMGIRGSLGNDTSLSDLYLAQIDFARTNTSGKVFVTYPWYPLHLYATSELDAGNIHFDGPGSVIVGEWDAYVRHMVEDLGVAWTPFWLSKVATPITVTGQTISILFDRPAGPDFTGTAPVLDTTFIGAAVSDGFRVKRSAADLTIGARTYYIDETTGKPAVSFNITETLSIGDVLEVSYAWYGSAQPAETHGGCWGNVFMKGPATTVRKDGDTMDAPLVPFKTTRTV